MREAADALFNDAGFTTSWGRGWGRGWAGLLLAPSLEPVVL